MICAYKLLQNCLLTTINGFLNKSSCHAELSFTTLRFFHSQFLYAYFLYVCGVVLVVVVKREWGRGKSKKKEEQRRERM